MIKDIKKGDIFLLAIFVAAALLIAFSPLLQCRGSSGKHSQPLVLKIRISGELYGTYDLNKNQSIQIQNQYGSNTLSIQSGTVSMTESDCRNQICVQTGPIEAPGQMIVCLPHELIAEITASSDSVAPSYDAISR
ncbi:NusG domain II-containing protein [Bacillota bacterium LCP21S3_D9]